MRIEYGFELDEVEVPRFAVEAVEGIGKLFTLATLVLNVLESRNAVELVFHGLNPDDPERKITAFREVRGELGPPAAAQLRARAGRPGRKAPRATTSGS